MTYLEVMTRVETLVFFLVYMSTYEMKIVISL